MLKLFYWKSRYSSIVVMRCAQVLGLWCTKSAQCTRIYGSAPSVRHLPSIILKGNPSPLFLSSTLIPPLMGKTFFPTRSPPLTGKEAVPLFFLASPALMGRPLLPQRPSFTSQPLIGRLTPLLSIPTFPHLLQPHHHLLRFHLFFPLLLTHLKLHH